MTSFHLHPHKEYLFLAPTPPPTPTERISKIINSRQELKSAKSYDHESEIQTVTALDILYKSYNGNTCSETSHSSQPIQIAIDSDSHAIQYDTDKTTLNADDDGEEDNCHHHYADAESSLCQTLYPYDAESIKNGVHYTQATGSPFPTTLPYLYNPRDEMLEAEGSPSDPLQSKPAQTASLFTSQFPKIEYLSIINDNSHQYHHQQEEEEPPSPPDFKLSSAQDTPTLHSFGGGSTLSKRTPITPETVLEAMSAFPDTDLIGFQSRRKPPPKQLYNKYKQRNSVLTGTIWD